MNNHDKLLYCQYNYIDNIIIIFSKSKLNLCKA